MSGNELLQKVIETSTIGADNGGLLNPEQSNKFIDYMFDATVLIAQARPVRMKSDTVDIDKIGVGQRLVRGATEAVDDGVNAGATFTKISLTTKKFRLDFELSSESLEDNLEGDALEDHIAQLMATQFGNDMEDVAINGDTSLTSDPLLKMIDGWRTLALDGAHVLDHGGAGLNRLAFNKALKAMPRKFMQKRNQLKWFVGSNLIQDYLYSLTNSSSSLIVPESVVADGFRSPVRTEGPAGFSTVPVFGVPAQEIPLFEEDLDGTYSGATGEHGELWLTDPKNLIWGVKREVTIYRQFKPKKDTIEYTVYVRAGTQIENLDAFVCVRNIKVAS